MFRVVLASLLVVLAVAVAIARRTPVRPAASGPAPVADASVGSIEAADADRTALVREALATEPDLSPIARLTRVTTTRGHVTLTGTAVSQRERARILVMTLEIAGSRNVTSHLELDATGTRVSWW